MNGLTSQPDELRNVAPDLGAAKLADRYARILDLPVAIVHKTRIGGDEELAGEAFAPERRESVQGPHLAR